jgi:hypothetical protein
MSDRSFSPTTRKVRAAAYERTPGILDGVRHALAELLSITRTYAPLQKYDVTLHALNAIARLVVGYISLRSDDLVMPTSNDGLFGQAPFRFDPVLTEAMEGLASLNKDAVGRGDVQLSRQVIGAIEHIGLESVGVVPLGSPPGENGATSFIQAFLFSSANEGAMHMLDDVTAAGANSLTAIGVRLLSRDTFLTVKSTMESVEKLGHLAIAQRKAHVTGESTRGLAEMLQRAVAAPVVGHYVIDALLDSLQRLTESEVRFPSDPRDYLSLRFSIGPFWDLTLPTALSNVTAVAIQNLASAVGKGEPERLGLLQDVLQELFHGLWERLAAFGSAAAATESFALFYVNLNIREISRQGIWLCTFLAANQGEPRGENVTHEEWLNDRFQSELLGELKWIIGATYWRIFEAFSLPIKTHLIWDFFPTLSDIGFRALDAGLPDLASSAIAELLSISTWAIATPFDGRLRSAARVASYIARIGIIADKLDNEKIAAEAVQALTDFDRKYVAKQIEIEPDAKSYDAALRNEIDDLVEDLRRRHWMMDEEEAAFFSRINPEDIRSFSERIPPPTAKR